MAYTQKIAADAVLRLKEILTELTEQPSALNFLEPVPWEELGLNNYPSIVKNPMDLRTCRRKLQKGAYNSY